MSQRLTYWVRLVCIASLASWARPAGAQLPVFEAPSEPSVVPPTVAAADDTPPPAPPPARAAVISAPPRVDDADYEDDEMASDPPPQRRWYGWQTLTVDGASLSAIFLGTAQSSADHDADGVVVLGLLGYGLGPGIVHFVHRNPGRGFASMGLRLGMPLAGAFFGATAASNCDGFLCEAQGAGIGMLVGMAGAIAIDAALFAYDERRMDRPRASSLFPLVSFAPQRAWVGLAGSL